MSAYLVLLFAVLSRLFPHALGGVGLDVTAVGGGLLFFGSRRPAREAIFAALAFAATDVYLTAIVFRYPFHLRDYAVTWLWYAAVPLLGRVLLAPDREPTNGLRLGAIGRTVAAVLVTSTSFFIVSNLMVFALGSLYPHTVASLFACYVAALPFYANDLTATSLTAAVLFGLPALAAALHRRYQLA